MKSLSTSLAALGSRSHEATAMAALHAHCGISATQNPALQASSRCSATAALQSSPISSQRVSAPRIPCLQSRPLLVSVTNASHAHSIYTSCTDTAAADPLITQTEISAFVSRAVKMLRCVQSCPFYRGAGADDPLMTQHQMSAVVPRALQTLRCGHPGPISRVAKRCMQCLAHCTSW